MRRWRPWSALVLAGLIGCEQQHPALVETVAVFRARANHDVPVPGVEVSVNGEPVGASDAGGELRVRLSGAEGMTFALASKCPPGFEGPTRLPSIVLGRYRSTSGKPEADFEVAIACSQRRRTLAVVLRAREMIRDSLRGRRRAPHAAASALAPLAGLPVLYANRPIATTDAAGLAHLALDVPARGKVLLALDTAGATRPLRPRSPTITLEPREDEDILVVDQTFAFDRDPPPVVIRAPSKRHLIKILRDGLSDGMMQLEDFERPAGQGAGSPRSLRRK